MDSVKIPNVVGRIRRWVDGERADGLADAELVRRFARDGDQAAFAALVRRHGDMVLAVCHGVLHQRQDAEDVLQATFLVLARKAHAIRKQESLASWLHGVAYRLALKARVKQQRRQCERQSTTEAGTAATALDELTVRECHAVLHEELRRLPEKFRLPLLLCYWEGKTRDEAAEQVGWAKGTFNKRLLDARARLRQRLTARGLAPSATLFAVLLGRDAAQGRIGEGMVQAITGAAVAFATGGTVANDTAMALAESGLRGFAIGQWARRLLSLALLVGVGVGGTAVATWAMHAPATERQPDGRDEWEVPVAAQPGQPAAVLPVAVAQDVRPQLPEAFVASAPVKLGELEFEALSGAVWPLPEIGGLSPIPLHLRATNRGKEAAAFVPIVGMPILKTADGKPLKAQCHGNNHLRVLPKPVTLAAGEGVTAYEPAELFGRDKGFLLTWEDEGGSVWSYDGLQTGRYLLHMHYKLAGREGKRGISIETRPVLIEIRELRASPAVVANQIQVRALADGVWPMPADGKASAIQLGFRISKTEKPQSARVIPAIKAVSLQTADGVEVAVKKSETAGAKREARALHMEPEKSRSLAEPALLSRAGEGLVLTWVDAGGVVWQAEGLRRGRYQVRLVIEGHKGKTPGDWTTWTGELKTAAVEVEIR